MQKSTPQVDLNLTKKVAHLARLQLTDEELQSMTDHLDHVLEYVEQLNEVDVEGVSPMVHPLDVETQLRADTVVPPEVDENGQSKNLQSAPDVHEAGFKVPPIL